MNSSILGIAAVLDPRFWLLEIVFLLLSMM